MAKIEKFEDLQVWQLARQICNNVWILFETTPLGRDFDLRNQMSRCSGSIMDNIAEGFERRGNREFIQFLNISKGSCGELRSQLYRTLDRNYINDAKFDEIAAKTNHLNQKIGSFISYLNKSDYKGTKFTSSTATPNAKP